MRLIPASARPRRLGTASRWVMREVAGLVQTTAQSTTRVSHLTLKLLSGQFSRAKRVTRVHAAAARGVW